MATTSWVGRIAASWLLAGSCCAQAGDFQGIVTYVTDGDTLWVRPLTGGAASPIRLEGIDAPEICQDHGTRSRDALAERALHQQVTVISYSNDSYQRTLGHVSLGREDLGRWMVSQGHAWSYRFRSDRGPYSIQEAQARSARRGLWSNPSPMQPRDFRKQHGSCKLS
jgi:micrococcal nuclease